MRLPGKQLEQLQEALVRAFPRHADLAQMVRTGLDVNLDHVAGGGNLYDVAFNLIEWAESRGRLNHLLWAAQKAAPRNIALQALAQELGAAPPDEPHNPLTAPRPTSTGETPLPLERMQLVRTLSSIVPPLFAQILFIVSPPPGIIGGPTAPQRERAVALLQWAEGPNGCGIDVIRKILDEVVGEGTTTQTSGAAQTPTGGPTVPEQASPSPLAERSETISPPRNIGRGVAHVTILELDLAGYSDVVRLLQQNLGAEAISLLNQQVQGFVDEGLKIIGVRREDTVAATTGDGAILVLERPEQAQVFAEAVHGAARAFNKERDATAQRWFRMGAFSGEIDRQTHPERGLTIAGEPIGNAVRLEGAARPGELLVDIKTWEALPIYIQDRYGPEEEVSGKRAEKFKVRRCIMTPPFSAAPETAKESSPEAAAQPPSQPTPPSEAKTAPASAHVDRHQIDNLMRRLEATLLDRLMFRIHMSPDRQPPPNSTPTFRKDEIMRWAAAVPERMQKLEAELNYLIENEQEGSGSI